MIGRTLLATLGGLALFLVGTVSAFALPNAVEGRPALTHDHPAGYYIWHDEQGMHLRTHGPDDEHLFVAYLHSDGVFVNVDSVRLESRDNYAILDGGHTLVLRFHTYDATDGVNFLVLGGTRLRLNLQLDDQLIDTDRIYLGAEGRHPQENPLTILR